MRHLTAGGFSMSRSRISLSLLVLALCVLPVVPASAEVFHVTLTNGSAYEGGAIFNNVIYRAAGKTVHPDSGISVWDSPGTRVFNNTVIQIAPDLIPTSTTTSGSSGSGKNRCKVWAPAGTDPVTGSTIMVCVSTGV